MSDTTEHELSFQLREARQELAALRQQLAGAAVTRLTESLIDGFALFDPSGRVLSVNPALCALTGFAAEELIGTCPPHPCWPPEQEARFLSAMAETLSGDVHTHELDLLRKDGERVPALVTPSVLRDDDGDVVSVSLLVRDLGERRRFEAALAESGELFRLTFDQAPLGAALYSDSGFDRVNDAFCAMLGYTREELLGLDFLAITHPDDRELSAEMGRLLLAGGADHVTLEKRYLRKDGQTVWARTEARAVRDADGRVIARLAMIDDVTDRKAVIEELSLSEQRLATVLDAAHEGIILQARDGSVLTFNNAAEAVFDVRHPDVIGQSALGRDWHTIHEDGSPWPAEDHPTMVAMATGRPVLDAVMGVVRGAETRWLDINAHPIIPDGEDEAVAAVVSFSDRTDRLNAERALSESEERYRLLLQNANDAVYVHEVKGSGVGRFIEVNDRACDMLGYTHAELLEMDVDAIDTPEQHERVPAIVEKLLTTGRAMFETEHVAKDGTRVPVEVSTRAFELQGRTVILSVTRDISERAAAERALQETRRLLDETQEISKLGGWEYDVTTGRFTWTEQLYRIHRVDPDFDVNDLRRNIGFYAPEDQAVIDAAFAEVLATGEPYDLELRFLPAGSERSIWVRTMARAEMLDGKVVRVVGNLIDVDERKRAEEALAAARERAQNYLDLAGVIIVAIDADGVVTVANRRTCEVLGRAESEVVGRDWFDLAVPDDVGPAVREVFDAFMRGEVEAREFFENHVVTATGERRLIAWHNVPLRDTDGAVAGTLSSGEDITERRALETTLRESEAKYREVVERAGDGIVLVRPDGILFANTAFCEMTGYAQDELARLPVVELIHPDQREAIADRARQRLAGEQVTSRYEVDLLRKDGSLVGVDLSAGVVDVGGKPTDLIVARDITERRQAERALRESEALRDRTEAIAHIGSWQWDPATRLALWSPEMYRLFDVDPDQFDGDSDPVIESRVHPDDRDALRVAVEEAAAGRPGPVEYRVVHRDGSEHVLLGEGAMEHDASGRFMGMKGYYRDVTAQRAAERTLREAEERYRSLFEQSPIPIWVEDFSAVRDWFDAQGDVGDWTARFDAHPEDAATCAGLVRILDCNEASLRFFGVSSREELHAELPRYFTEESYLAFRDELVTLAQGGTSFAAVLPIASLDGGRFIVDLRLSVVRGHEPRLDRVLVSFTDVTEQRAAEAEIRRLNEELQRRVVSRTEQLDAATRELEALAYSIAHDVRAPLRTIDGFSAAVIEDEAARLSPDGVTALRRVRTAAQTLARLLDDLMSLSHVSRRELTRREVDISTIARQVGEETAADHPSRQVDLTIAPGLAADADPALVRLIFRELLGNAWKFTAPHGSARVEVGARDAADERAFYVRDDGVGFDMRFAEHLFGVFQRMHPPGEFEGDGVGLATVQRLVRRHGGRAWAESEPERGTTVYFTLPGESEAPRAGSDS